MVEDRQLNLPSVLNFGGMRTHFCLVQYAGGLESTGSVEIEEYESDNGFKFRI
jgi:hypothetical protein